MVVKKSKVKSEQPKDAVVADPAKAVAEKEAQKAAQPPSVVPKNQAQKIWDEIKDAKISVYALPEVSLANLVTVFGNVTGGTLYLKPQNQMVVVALEEKFGDKYVINTMDNGFISITYPEVEFEEEDEFILFPRPNGKVYKVNKKDF